VVPHPYRAFLALVAVLVAGLLGYRHGVETERNACAADAARVAHAAATAARLDAESESARRLEQAQRLATSAAASREARL